MSHEWMECDKDDLFTPNDVYERPIFPLHSCPELRPMERRVKLILVDHCEQLHGWNE